MAKKISEDQIRSGLEGLSGWKMNAHNRLEREFKFGSFREAFSFMTRVAFEAEEMNHHPDWSNSYSRVKVELMTHDAGGVTQNDLELARRINSIDWS